MNIIRELNTFSNQNEKTNSKLKSVINFDELKKYSKKFYNKKGKLELSIDYKKIIKENKINNIFLLDYSNEVKILYNSLNIYEEFELKNSSLKNSTGPNDIDNLLQVENLITRIRKLFIEKNIDNFNRTKLIEKLENLVIILKWMEKNF